MGMDASILQWLHLEISHQGRYSGEEAAIIAGSSATEPTEIIALTKEIMILIYIIQEKLNIFKFVMRNSAKIDSYWIRKSLIFEISYFGFANPRFIDTKFKKIIIKRSIFRNITLVFGIINYIKL